MKKCISNILLTFPLHFVCLGILLACKSAQCMCLVPMNALDPPGARVTGGCEPPCRSWELNLDHLEEEPVFLSA